MQPLYVENQATKEEVANKIDLQVPTPNSIVGYNGRKVSCLNSRWLTSFRELEGHGQAAIVVCVTAMAIIIIFPELVFLLGALDCTKHPKIAKGQLCFDQNGEVDQTVYTIASVLYPTGLAAFLVYRCLKKSRCLKNTSIV